MEGQRLHALLILRFAMTASSTAKADEPSPPSPWSTPPVPVGPPAARFWYLSLFSVVLLRGTCHRQDRAGDCCGVFYGCGGSLMGEPLNVVETIKLRA